MVLLVWWAKEFILQYCRHMHVNCISETRARFDVIHSKSGRNINESSREELTKTMATAATTASQHSSFIRCLLTIPKPSNPPLNQLIIKCVFPVANVNKPAKKTHNENVVVKAHSSSFGGG